MTTERYNAITASYDEKLTEAEIVEGWHFCVEMDGLLANSNDAEGDCFCELNKHRKEE